MYVCLPVHLCAPPVCGICRGQKRAPEPWNWSSRQYGLSCECWGLTWGLPQEQQELSKADPAEEHHWTIVNPPHVIIISLKKNDKHDLWRICSNSQQQGCCCSCWYAYSFLLLNTKRQVFLTCYVFSQVNFCVFIDLCTPVKPNCKYTLANMSPS